MLAVFRSPAFHNLFAVTVLSLICGDSIAGKRLDYIRNYDLDDYALGLASTVGQSPFVNDDNSVVACPYLTSPHNAAFTADGLLINDGDLGVRWVSDGGWVLGAVGRFNITGAWHSCQYRDRPGNYPCRKSAIGPHGF